MAVQGFGKTICDFLSRFFFFKSSKEFIPDDEHISVIFIKIFFIRRMMHTVMTGRNQYIFQNAQVPNQPCVNEERVEAMYKEHTCYHAGRKANNRQN